MIDYFVSGRVPEAGQPEFEEYLAEVRRQLRDLETKASQLMKCICEAERPEPDAVLTGEQWQALQTAANIARADMKGLEPQLQEKKLLASRFEDVLNSTEEIKRLESSLPVSRGARNAIEQQQNEYQGRAAQEAQDLQAAISNFDIDRIATLLARQPAFERVALHLKELRRQEEEHCRAGERRIDQLLADERDKLRRGKDALGKTMANLAFIV